MDETVAAGTSWSPMADLCALGKKPIVRHGGRRLVNGWMFLCEAVD